MTDDKVSLSKALDESIRNEFRDKLREVVNTGIENILQTDIIRNIPFLSTVISVFHIGTSIRDLHYLHKLGVFILEINEGEIDEKKLRKFQNEFEDNEKLRNKQICYILLLIDRYLSDSKVHLLAKLVINFYNEKLDWTELCKYAEVIERFLPGDFEKLISSKDFNTKDDINTDSLQRLNASGLVIEKIRKSNYQIKNGKPIVTTDDPDVSKDNERIYLRTKFGDKLVEITSK